MRLKLCISANVVKNLIQAKLVTHIKAIVKYTY